MIKGLDGRQKPALLISEMQRAMVDSAIDDRHLARSVVEMKMVPAIAALAEAFRDAKAPVVHCTLVPEQDYCGFPVHCALAANIRRKRNLYEGAPGAEIVSGLEPAADDIVLERRAGLTAFHATELERELRVRDVNTIVLVGVSTNIALMGIAIEAVNRLFNVVLPLDCVAGGDVKGHEAQIAHHFPLLAAISNAANVSRALLDRRWAAAEPRPNWDRAVATYLN